MSCFTVSALALRLATASAHDISAEPLATVQSGCGIEIGAGVRNGAPIVDAGLRIDLTGPLWLRIGAEGEYTPRVSVRPAGAAAEGVQGLPRGEIKETVDRHFRIRARLSLGATVPIYGSLSAQPELNLLHGGRALLSVRWSF